MTAGRVAAAWQVRVTCALQQVCKDLERTLCTAREVWCPIRDALVAMPRFQRPMQRSNTKPFELVNEPFADVAAALRGVCVHCRGAWSVPQIPAPCRAMFKFVRC